MISLVYMTVCVPAPRCFWHAQWNSQLTFRTFKCSHLCFEHIKQEIRTIIFPESEQFSQKSCCFRVTHTTLCHSSQLNLKWPMYPLINLGLWCLWYTGLAKNRSWGTGSCLGRGWFYRGAYNFVRERDKKSWIIVGD